MGYLGVQFLRGLERFSWHGIGTPGVECNEVCVCGGKCRDCSRGQAGGWGLFGKKNPTMGTDKDELWGDAAEGRGGSFGEQREVNVQICVWWRSKTTLKGDGCPKDLGRGGVGGPCAAWWEGGG